MRIQVEYSAQARVAAGVATEMIEAPSGSLTEVLRLVAAKHGDGLGCMILDADRNPHSALMLFVNDEHRPSGSATLLRDGDALSIVPPMSGG